MPQSPSRAQPRRTVVAGLAAALVAPAIGISVRAQGKQVVVRTGGGGYDEAKRASVYEPFTRETGIEIVLVAANATKMLALARAGSDEIDVYDTNDETLLQISRANGLAPIDYAGFKFTDPADLPAALRQPQYAGHSYFATLLGFNTSRIKPGSEPANWAQFFDVQRFPGARSMPNPSLGEPTLEFALIADGVPKDKLYPLDVDRAFKKLDQIKKHVAVWWTTGAQSAQILIDKEAVIGTAWNGRYYGAIKNGAPILIEWNHGAIKESAFGIPKGAKDVYWGQKFLALAAEAKPQGMYADIIGYPGLNLEASKYTSPAMVPYLPTAAENLPGQFWTNLAWWNENGKAMEERWQRWMLQK